jgi:hypothetical protein
VVIVDEILHGHGVFRLEFAFWAYTPVVSGRVRKARFLSELQIYEFWECASGWNACSCSAARTGRSVAATNART